MLLFAWIVQYGNAARETAQSRRVSGEICTTDSRRERGGLNGFTKNHHKNIS